MRQVFQCAAAGSDHGLRRMTEVLEVPADNDRL